MLSRLTLSLLLLATPVLAQEPAITLSGDGITPLELTMADLAALPQTTQEVTFLSSGEERHVSYTGTLLWPILEGAGLLDGIDRNAELARSVAVTASDGYVVVFSVGEMHPDFGNAPIMLAVMADDAPLAADEGGSGWWCRVTRAARAMSTTSRTSPFIDAPDAQV